MFQGFSLLLISFGITRELFIPKLCSAFRAVAKLATLMSMPEASVYKDNCFMFRENDIRFSRQGLLVKPEPITQRMKYRPDDSLGGSVGTPNT